MEVILLYSADAWLSHDSQELIAVCTTKENAVKLAAESSGYTDEPLTDEQQTALFNEYQTQGRTENFMLAAAELNTLC